MAKPKRSLDLISEIAHKSYTDSVGVGSLSTTDSVESESMSMEHTHTVEDKSMSVKYTLKAGIIRRSEAPERKSQRLNLLVRPSFGTWAKEICKSQGYSLNDAVFEGLQLWAAERGCAPYEGSKKA